jgi:hypothetical protein
MGFWLYQNWTDGYVVRLHAGGCGFCKEGRGRSGRGTEPRNGRWLGPYETLAAAHEVAATLRGDVSEHSCCRNREGAAPARPADSGPRPTKVTPFTEDGAPGDFLLLSCSARKMPRRAAAKDLYASPGFRRRRGYAEASGKPWAILSAKHGLLLPEECIEPYDVRLDDLSAEERRAWAARVASRLEAHLGSLSGRTFEILAGKSYAEPLEPELRRRGAQVTRPLRHVSLYQEASWFAEHTPGRPSGERPRPAAGGPKGVGLAHRLTKAFMAGDFDLSQRPQTAPVGWHGLPEVPAAAAVRGTGASEPQVRLFLTFTSAMDRARDAERLWQAASALYLERPELFTPHYILSESDEVANSLVVSGVSQRHGPDLATWRRLAQTLAFPPQGSAVAQAIGGGIAKVSELLAERMLCTTSGEPLYPMLRGPKVGPMWVRILAYPGDAKLTGLDVLPVAVDVQVLRASQCLGVVGQGLTIDAARPLIQQAWRDDVTRHGAAGPPGLEDTCAALDPALWFFGKYGCSHCERVSERVAVGDICEGCAAEF